MQPLPLNELGATPWSLDPIWFVVIALVITAFVWLGLAWRRALMECPNRIRRAGVKEMRRLARTLQRTGASPQPAHLHACLRASARVWDVRTSAPCPHEFSQAVLSLSGDANVTSHWRELWVVTEHNLYAPASQPAREWTERVVETTNGITMPQRERFFPNRLGHWLPLAAVMVVVFFSATTETASADVPWSAPPASTPQGDTTTSSEASPATSSAMSSTTSIDSASSTERTSEDGSSTKPDSLVTTAAGSSKKAAVVGSSQKAAAKGSSEEFVAAAAEPLPPEVRLAAQTALASNWNDWAAHSNLALFETQQGNLNLAIAHATAAFVQHPADDTTRATLLAALGETEIVDANLRRLLAGSWYERAPALLSPSSWQRVALFAALLVAASLIMKIVGLYVSRERSLLVKRPIVWTSRSLFAAGAALLVVSISSWNAYGALNQPDAAILVQGANVSPVPTDLVPTEETSPLAAGAIVRTQRTFLGWRQVIGSSETAGWVRENALMPLYAAT